MASADEGRRHLLCSLAVLVVVIACRRALGSDAGGINGSLSSDDDQYGLLCPNAGLKKVPIYCNVSNEDRTIACHLNTSYLAAPIDRCNTTQECLLHFFPESGGWMFSSICHTFDITSDYCICKSVDNTFPPKKGFVCHRRSHCPTLDDPVLYFDPIQITTPTPSLFPPPPPSPPPSPYPSSSSTPVASESDNTGLVAGVTVSVSVVVFGVVLVCFTAPLCWWCKRKRNLQRLTNDTRRSSVLNITSEYPPFALNHLVSRGRYGQVYQTEYKGELVAVKIFSSQNRVSWENERTLFGMQSTKHRNVIDYTVAGMWGSGQQLQMFIVTPFYPLGSLNRFLARNSVSWEQACRVIHSISSGLSHLHAENYTDSSGVNVEKYAIAHRDIKSANVLVRGENGDCVISDLGFALILDPTKDEKDMANTGQVGTYRYMAPEVLDARISLQDLQAFKQIDIYSLGLVMWEVVWRCNVQEEEGPRNYIMAYEDTVGQRPGIDTMRDLVCTQKIRPRILPAWRNHPGLSSLATTIEECWDEDPEARLSASNVILRLKELLDGGSTVFSGDRTPSHGFPHPSVVPGNEAYRMAEVLLESTTDTIGTTDSRPPPYDSRWSYIPPAVPAEDADSQEEHSVTTELNIETTV